EGHGALPSPRGSRRGLLRAGDKGVEVADVHKYASTLTSSPLRGVGKGDHDAREDAHGEPLAHARLRNSKVYGGIAAPEQPRCHPDRARPRSPRKTSDYQTKRTRRARNASLSRRSALSSKARSRPSGPFADGQV